MITRLVSRYEDCLTGFKSSDVLRKDNMLIASLLKSTNLEGLTGYRGVYERLLSIHAESAAALEEHAYQRNIKTLWKITVKAKECIDQIVSPYIATLSDIEENLDKVQNQISHQVNNKVFENLGKGTSPLSCVAQPELLNSREALLNEKISIRNNIDFKISTAICNLMQEFTKLVIEDESYLLMHDIIYFLDNEHFCPYLDTKRALQEISLALVNKPWVTQNSEVSENVQKTHEESARIKTYLDQVSSKHLADIQTNTYFK